LAGKVCVLSIFCADFHNIRHCYMQRWQLQLLYVEAIVFLSGTATLILCRTSNRCSELPPKRDS
jgi:hypothetical protein